MKIRNIPFKELNEKEKRVVTRFWKSQTETQIDAYGEAFCECENHPECLKGIEQFWEVHREEDTDNGQYDGWIE